MTPDGFDAAGLLVPTALCFGSLGFLGASFATAMGVGPSIVFLPALLWLLPYLGVEAASVASIAVGTSLAASCVVMCSGTLAHWRAGNLRRSPAELRGLLTAAACGGVLGGTVVLRASGLALYLIVAAGQLLIAAVLAWRVVARAAAGRGSPGVVPLAPAGTPQLVRLENPASRFYVGVVGMLTTVGAGGVLLVPYFLWRGVPRAAAAALACAVGVAIAGTATAVFVLAATAADGTPAGLWHLPAAAALATGALLGGRQGARLATTIRPGVWLTLLAAVLVVSALRSVLRVL